MNNFHTLFNEWVTSYYPDLSEESWKRIIEEDEAITYNPAPDVMRDTGPYDIHGNESFISNEIDHTETVH